MAKRVVTWGMIYTSIILIAIVGMHYNVKSMRIHDEVISLKLILHSLEEENQRLRLKQNTIYSLKNIYMHAVSSRMHRPNMMSFITLNDDS